VAVRSPVSGEADSVLREITAFHQDDAGDWVAEFSCGHDQHVRHRPPFQTRPWVTDDEERTARIGSALDCPLCDRAELPAGLRVVRSGQTWSNDSVPPALMRNHRLSAGNWGWLHVREGMLGFTMDVEPGYAREVRSGHCQGIPPEIGHRIELLGPVRFTLSFLSSEALRERNRGAAAQAPAVPDEGGEAACSVQSVCPRCGVVLDGSPHRPPCSAEAGP
jgi:tellurite resistance-related uncharacterized protein